MTVVDFFNPKNIEYIKAFEYFMEEGRCPKDFCIEKYGVDFYNSKWGYKLVEKISDTYIKEFKNKSSKLKIFLCYSIDNYNGNIISEDFILNIVLNFISSKYNRME